MGRGCGDDEGVEHGDHDKTDSDDSSYSNDEADGDDASDECNSDFGVAGAALPYLLEKACFRAGSILL